MEYKGNIVMAESWFVEGSNGRVVKQGRPPSRPLLPVKHTHIWRVTSFLAEKWPSRLAPCGR